MTFLSRNFVVPNGSVEISYEGANRVAQLSVGGLGVMAELDLRGVAQRDYRSETEVVMVGFVQP